MQRARLEFQVQRPRLGQAIDMYKMTNKSLPDSLEVLAEPDVHTGQARPRTGATCA